MIKKLSSSVSTIFLTQLGNEFWTLLLEQQSYSNYNVVVDQRVLGVPVAEHCFEDRDTNLEWEVLLIDLVFK